MLHHQILFSTFNCLKQNEYYMLCVCLSAKDIPPHQPFHPPKPSVYHNITTLVHTHTHMHTLFPPHAQLHGRLRWRLRASCSTNQELLPLTAVVSGLL